MPVTKQLVDSLAQLPLELALEIIDDLRVWDVIKLMLRDNPKVNSYLLAHDRCKGLLGKDGQALAKTREQIKAYLDFASERNLDLCLPHYSIYRRSLYQRSVNDPDDGDDRALIVSTIHLRVWEMIPTWTVDLLRPYVKSPNLLPSISAQSSLEDYKRFWHVMAEAKTTLSHRCAHQLLRAAELLEQNPDILKRAMDPEQKRRPNTRHNVSWMQQAAHRILHRSTRDFRRPEFFSYEFFPVIPFDDTLAELLRMMEEYKMTSGKEVLLAGPQPPAIKTLVQTVVEGMPYFYPLEPVRPTERPEWYIQNAKGDILRTKYTPWSDDSTKQFPWEDANAVAFTPTISPHIRSFRRVGTIRGLKPHSMKEEKWLEAFVELYRYLERAEKEDQSQGLEC